MLVTPRGKAIFWAVFFILASLIGVGTGSLGVAFLWLGFAIIVFNLLRCPRCSHSLYIHKDIGISIIPSKRCPKCGLDLTKPYKKDKHLKN